MSGLYPDPTARRLITTSLMMATTMVALDGTIANVALPHMQSSVSASQEQIVWVLTSYLIATAVATPLSGWLADRFGRKRVMLISVAGFTLASMACGIATNLHELVLYRLVQGLCGAGLVPLSQATMLDINPPDRVGKAMAVFGMGTIMGPVIGPTLGGWLTDSFSWRWIFFVNVPFGILALLGLSASMTESRVANLPRFDLMGFAFLSIFVGALQLMLDRGQQLDWFSSWEVCIEAGAALLFLYLTVVHMWTAKHPFIRPAVFRDRNFLTGSIVGMQLGVLVYAVLALVAPMLQHLMRYPVMLTGLVTMPRGIGTMISMYTVGQFIGRVDARHLLMMGLFLCAVSLYQMAHLSLEMGSWPIVVAGFVQGLGAGLVFVPVTTIMFSTLGPRYRNEGAALNSLSRNMGAAIGISVLQALTIRNTATVESRLTEGVRPDNPIMDMRLPDFDFNLPSSVAGIEQEIVRQATMVAYLDSFWFLFLVTLSVIPVVLLMKPTKKATVLPNLPIMD